MSILPFKKTEKLAIIFIGIQASGKTTFYHRMLSDGYYTHISLDNLHTRNKERQELAKCLEGGKSFVIDNTNCPQAARIYDADYKLVAEYFPPENQVTGYEHQVLACKDPMD